MKTLFLVVVLVFITSISLFSATEQEIITKLKEIDKAMAQGTINYKISVFNEKNETKMSTRSFVYDSKGKSKSTIEIIQPDNTKDYVADYVDDKYYFFTFTRDNSIVIANKTGVTHGIMKQINQSSFESISASPSLLYGRGLTLMEDLKIDPTKNIATAYISDGSMIKAYLDPNLDYAAYKLEKTFEVTHPSPGSSNKSEMNNSKPILVDGKYYVFSKSTRNYIGLDKMPRKADFEIISATFKTPDEKDYIFDWSKNTFENITDSRGTKEEKPLIEYKKSELPEGITLDGLLKKTKRKIFMMKITDMYNKIVPDNASLAKIIFVVLCLVVLIIIKKKNKKKMASP